MFYKGYNILLIPVFNYTLIIMVNTLTTSKFSKGLLERIPYFCALKNGWYNGEGIAINQILMENLITPLSLYLSTDLPDFYWYPTLDGGVRAEYKNDHVDVSIEFYQNHPLFTAHILNLQSDHD